MLTQLLAWREIELPRPQVYYWRTAAGAEVDFVIESKSRLLAVEVKATPRARLEEGRSLEPEECLNKVLKWLNENDPIIG